MRIGRTLWSCHGRITGNFEHPTVERDGCICVITFERPEKANALDFQRIAETEAAVLAFLDDAVISIVIFTNAEQYF